jgi:hypothetical protein
MDNMIPVLSLVIAALAVFFGPLAQLCIARRQIRVTSRLAEQQMQNATAVARRQIVAPIRQRWIDDLRGHVADLVSKAQTHWIYQTDTETAHRNLLFAVNKIELMLNPHESDHQELKAELNRLIEVVLRRKEERTLADFTGSLTRTTSLAQAVFKREWERVKNEG